MNIDVYKRELLYRKAQGRKISNRYEDKVNKIFLNGREGCVRLSLVETDKVVECARSKSWVRLNGKSCNSFGEFVECCLAGMVDKECYLLIDEDWKFCGGLKIPAGAKINKDFDFDECLSDELRFFAVDFSFQATVDYCCGGDPMLYEFELKASVSP
jgi:hypothetical protein